MDISVLVQKFNLILKEILPELAVCVIIHTPMCVILVHTFISSICMRTVLGSAAMGCMWANFSSACGSHDWIAW